MQLVDEQNDAAFLFWEINGQNRSVIEFATVEARASYNKDLVYRRWSAGHGGTYVIFMPNNITSFRFADGPVNNPATYDSSGLRKVADYIRPLCNKPTD